MDDWHVDWNENKIPKREGNYERKKKIDFSPFSDNDTGNKGAGIWLASLIISNSKREAKKYISKKGGGYNIWSPEVHLPFKRGLKHLEMKIDKNCNNIRAKEGGTQQQKKMKKS